MNLAEMIYQVELAEVAEYEDALDLQTAAVEALKKAQDLLISLSEAETIKEVEALFEDVVL